MGFLDRVKSAAEGVQAQTSKVGIGASAEQMALANKAQHLMKEGVDTPAQIDSMTPTGNTDTPGGSEHTIMLTVSPAGGEAYPVTITQYVYPAFPFAAGDAVSVKVDPADRNVVMIFAKG
jgi:hypothetical protein